MHPLVNKLDSIWRLFGTGLSFVVFGVAGLFLSIFVFPLLFVFLRNAKKRQLAARRLIGMAFGAFIRMMKGLGALSYEVEGLEHAGTGHNQLIVANHPSLIDVVFLISVFPLADCVIKKAVTKNLFMRGADRHRHQFDVARVPPFRLFSFSIAIRCRPFLPHPICSAQMSRFFLRDKV